MPGRIEVKYQDSKNCDRAHSFDVGAKIGDLEPDFR